VIKILDIKTMSDFVLEISFSNGETAHFDGADYLASRAGSLLEPLRNSAVFNQCFVDAGALCWPNGLELSAERVFALSRVLA
jgi:Protein of unknown function (DUF2442)